MAKGSAGLKQMQVPAGLRLKGERKKRLTKVKQLLLRERADR